MTATISLNELKRPKPHPLRPVFMPYSKAAIARKLGLNTSYLRAILTGVYVPSKEVEGQLRKLAAQIQDAEERQKEANNA